MPNHYPTFDIEERSETNVDSQSETVLYLVTTGVSSNSLADASNVNGRQHRESASG